jgi:hypothetical protein
MVTFSGKDEKKKTSTTTKAAAPFCRDRWQTLESTDGNPHLWRRKIRDRSSHWFLESYKI